MAVQHTLNTPEQGSSPGLAARTSNGVHTEEVTFALPEPPRSGFSAFLDNLREAFSKPELPEGLTSKSVRTAEFASGAWYKSIAENFKAFFSPPTLPPDITSKPIDVEYKSEEIWFKSLGRTIKEMIVPPKEEALVVTSKPVEVKDIWSRRENRGRASLVSFVIHVTVIFLLFTVSFTPMGKDLTKQITDNVPIFIPSLPPQAQQAGGGGGGGDRSPTPAPKAKLPKPALRQFTPPQAVVKNPEPKLIMEPTVLVPPDMPLPQLNTPNFGDALASITGPPSNGTGSGGGIGSGSGGGVGSGRGGGVGPGSGGGVGGGAFRVGGGVSAPQIVFKVEPEYSEEARKAKFQGTVVLYVEVDEKGRPTNLRVVRPLGLGLDEKAIEAVKQWKFRPGLKDGQAVRVAAQIEVNFRLL